MATKTHTHYWECMDIPGFFFCECGADRHYLGEEKGYCIHENEEEC